MRVQMRAAFAVAVSVAVLSTTSAGANTIVIGQKFAQTCAERALAGGRDDITLDYCNLAIKNEDMDLTDTAKTFVNRGVVLMRRGVYDAALKDLATAEETLPGLPEIYVNRGVVFIHQQKYVEALAQIDKGIAMKPDQIEKAYYDRALARERTGDIKGAYLDYSMAQKLKPNWELPQKELARFTVQRPG